MGYVPVSLKRRFSHTQTLSACASESLAYILFGKKHPSQATTNESVDSRLRKLLDTSLPGFFKGFGGTMAAADLLTKHDGVVGAAYFEAVRAYCPLWASVFAIELTG